MKAGLLMIDAFTGLRACGGQSGSHADVRARRQLFRSEEESAHAPESIPTTACRRRFGRSRLSRWLRLAQQGHDDPAIVGIDDRALDIDGAVDRELAVDVRHDRRPNRISQMR